MPSAPRRAATVLAVLVAALALVAAPAGATVAPDAETAVRDIVFPVDGEHTYTDTFGACRSGCSRGHEGTDIMAAKLTPLVAATDATVTWLKDTATPDGTQGNYLMLRDADGWEMELAQFFETLRKPGSAGGQSIVASGQDGPGMAQLIGQQMIAPAARWHRWSREQRAQRGHRGMARTVLPDPGRRVEPVVRQQAVAVLG